MLLFLFSFWNYTHINSIRLLSFLKSAEKNFSNKFEDLFDLLNIVFSDQTPSPSHTPNKIWLCLRSLFLWWAWPGLFVNINGSMIYERNYCFWTKWLIICFSFFFVHFWWFLLFISNASFHCRCSSSMNSDLCIVVRRWQFPWLSL